MTAPEHNHARRLLMIIEQEAAVMGPAARADLVLAMVRAVATPSNEESGSVGTEWISIARLIDEAQAHRARMNDLEEQRTRP